MKIRSSAELVEILENYLKEKKISRRQFCALVDIPNSTISSWKSKNVLPSIELVAKVAKFMNVSLDWLVYGEIFENVKAPGEIITQKEEFINYLYTPQYQILSIFNSLMTNAQYQVIDKKKIIDEAIELAKYMNKKSKEKLSCAQ